MKFPSATASFVQFVIKSHSFYANELVVFEACTVHMVYDTFAWPCRNGLFTYCLGV